MAFVRITQHPFEVVTAESLDPLDGDLEFMGLKLANVEEDYRSSLYYLEDGDFQAAMGALTQVVERFERDPVLLTKCSQGTAVQFEQIVKANDASIRLRLLGLSSTAAMNICQRLREGWGMAVMHKDDAQPEWIFFLVYKKEGPLAGAPIPVWPLFIRALKAS